MQLLKDAVPRAAQVAVLMDRDLPYDQAQWQQLELAAYPLNVKLRRVVVRHASELEGAFRAIEQDLPDALFVIQSELNFVNRARIAELAGKSHLPTMSGWREWTEAGGLMSYGFVRADSFHRAAIYVAKILKGVPADLPVEQPTKYELVINLKCARSLNLEIPRPLLLIADEVIE
jgi:putative tryptophan/tyrosine transport system substrate-binding protein